MNKVTIITAPADRTLRRMGAIPRWAENTIVIYAPDQDVETFHFEAAQDIQLAAETFAKAYRMGGRREVEIVHDSAILFPR